MFNNRSQCYLPDVPRNNSRCDGNIGDRLGRQQLPRRGQRGDSRCDVNCRTKEVVRSSEYWAVVEPGPGQWNPWLGSAGWKQTSEHLKGGCRVRKSKHRFVTYPLDWRPDLPEGFAHQLLEAPKHRYCRRISIDIRNCAEARQIDERDGRDCGLETGDRANTRIHSRLWWGGWCGSSVDSLDSRAFFIGRHGQRIAHAAGIRSRWPRLRLVGASRAG